MSILLIYGCSQKEYDPTRYLDISEHYNRARDFLNQKKYETAIEFYNKLEARYPYGAITQQAVLDTAYAYWKSNEPEMAMVYCDRFIREHPKHQKVDYAYYLKGLITFNDKLGILGIIGNQDLSDRDSEGNKKSYDAFSTLVTQFPNSIYAADAKMRLRYLVYTLAAHEANIAEFYFERDAYVAALQRASYVIKSYPETPAVERALAVMLQSYQQLNMTDLYMDTKKILETNYPDNWLLVGSKDKAWW